MTKFGLTFSDGNASVCQTGYIYSSPDQARCAAERFFDHGAIPIGGLDYFPGSGKAGPLLTAIIEGDNYMNYGEVCRERTQMA